jgi:hypothetical protein
VWWAFFTITVIIGLAGIPKVFGLAIGAVTEWAGALLGAVAGWALVKRTG